MLREECYTKDTGAGMKEVVTDVGALFAVVVGPVTYQEFQDSPKGGA